MDSHGLLSIANSAKRNAIQNEFTNFLTRFGSQVIYFTVELVDVTQFQTEWYATIVAWINLMSNLEVLTVSTPTRSPEYEAFSMDETVYDQTEWNILRLSEMDRLVVLKQEMRKICFPTVIPLKRVHFKHCHISFVKEVLRANPGLETISLQKLPYVYSDDWGERWSELIKLENLKTLNVSVDRYLWEFEYKLDWSPSTLKLDARNLDLFGVLSYCEKWGKTLRKLELILPLRPQFGSCRRKSQTGEIKRKYPYMPVGKMNNLKSVTLNFTKENPARAFIQIITELQNMSFTTLTVKIYNRKAETLRTGWFKSLRVFSDLDKLETSLIWEWMPTLRKLKVMRTSAAYNLNEDIPLASFQKKVCTRDMMEDHQDENCHQGPERNSQAGIFRMQ